MAPTESPRIPQRVVAPGGPSLSLLSFTVLPSPLPGGSGDEAVVQRLRRARAAGVTTFDVAGSPEGAPAERLLARAFPQEDHELVVIVGRRLEDLVRRDGGEAAPGQGPDGAPERLRSSVQDSNRRLAPLSVGIVEWTGEVLTGLESGPAMPSEAQPPCLFRKMPANNALPREDGDVSRRPLWLTGVLSLLHTEVVPAIEAAPKSRPVAYLVRDPFAGGRLDGTRAAQTAVDRGPGAEPPRLRDLQKEFAPVLGLAFLTEQRKRTLAQAALHYAVHREWVKTVIVPLPTVDRLEEVLDVFATPPLSGQELQRIESVSDSRAD
jgi:aryl-alcohol dehydrogenase-like predicted oxidoreductase